MELELYNNNNTDEIKINNKKLREEIINNYINCCPLINKKFKNFNNIKITPHIILTPYYYELELNTIKYKNNNLILNNCIIILKYIKYIKLFNKQLSINLFNKCKKMLNNYMYLILNKK